MSNSPAQSLTSFRPRAGPVAADQLILCPDQAAFEAAVDKVLSTPARVASESAGVTSRAIPVLIPPTRLGPYRLPSELQVIKQSDWNPRSGAISEPAALTSRRICLAVDEPACVACASLLAHMTGRRLLVSSPGDMEDRVRRLAGDDQIDSLTILVPAWCSHNGTGALDPALLALIVAELRKAFRRGHRKSWGILTGVDSVALSETVARSVLQEALGRSYAGRPFAALVEEGEALHSDLTASVHGLHPSSVSLFHPQSGNLDDLHTKRWNGILFTGHGRSYCSCSGCLCAARFVADSPALPLASCLSGMACQPGFRQLDPGLYKTPVAVLDTCGAASTGSFLWGMGLPPIALMMASGSADAVIASDTMLANSPAGQTRSLADVLWALGSADTLGEATMRLNQLRSIDNASSPFLLLGDPDSVSGGRWPHFARLEEPGLSGRQNERRIISLTLPGPLFCGIRTAASTDPLFVSSPDTSLKLTSLTRFEASPGRGELWFQAAGRDGTYNVNCESKRVRQPRGEILRSAERFVPQRQDWTKGSADALSILDTAADQLLETSRMLQGAAARGVVVGPPAATASLATGAEALWQASLKTALQLLVRLSPGGLWPWDLWSNTAPLLTCEGPFPCPACGWRPTLRRTYRTPSRAKRILTECPRCEIVADEPHIATRPGLALGCPEAVLMPGRAEAILSVDNTRGRGACSGAVALAVANKGHNVTVDPDVVTFRIPAGQCRSFPFRLSSTTTPPIPHRYGLRVFGLLDGRWHWLSSHVLVTGQKACPAADRDDG